MWSIFQKISCIFKKNMYINGMFSIYFLSQLTCQIKPIFLYWFYSLYDLSINVSGVLNFLNIILLLSISPFKSVNICFMYLGALILGAHIFTNIISYSRIDPIVICNIFLCLVTWVKVAQWCQTLCDPMDYTVHGIL